MAEVAELWTLIPLHTLAGVIWAGSQIYLAFVLIPWVQKNNPPNATNLLKNGTPLLHALLAIQFLTGFRLGMIHGGSPAVWFSFADRSATVAAVKVTLLVVIFALEFYKLRQLKSDNIAGFKTGAIVSAFLSIIMVLLGLNNRLGFLF